MMKPSIPLHYKVFPDTPIPIKGESPASYVPQIVVLLVGISSVGTIIFLIINVFNGGKEWLLFLALFFLSVSNMGRYIKKADKKHSEERVIKEAESYSLQLNELINKSEEIIDNILPYYENSIIQYLKNAERDFTDNVISQFWDNIEETSKQLAYYKEAIDQLTYNGELYSKILLNKKHNFPKEFPIKVTNPISESVLINYSSLIRRAQSKFEFANIWEHRKTQKILIAGFQTLADAINNLRIEILNSIRILDNSIKTEFRELKNIQLEQIQTFHAGHRMLNETLTNIDKKLYYIQYKEKPNVPFQRPLFE